MTNPTLPDHGAVLPPERFAFAPVGGKPRPVKVVELPVFLAARSRLEAPYIAIRVPVVALNGPAPETAGRAATTAAPAS